MKSSYPKKSSEKSSIYHHVSPKLTKKEKEIFILYSKEFLTIKQISISRGITERAVRKTIKKIRDKGFLDAKNMDGTFKGYGMPDVELFSKHSIRFHGLEFNIKILWKDYRYEDVLKKSNTISLDGNLIRLFKDAVEVYVNKSFYGESVQGARDEGFKYSFWLFDKLEKRLSVLLVKQGSQNVKVVKQHFSEVNNELAKDLNVKHEKLSVRGDDGKVWLLVDNSFNLHELETTHPQLAEKDMELIKAFFDDVRKHPTLNSDILLLVQELSKQVLAMGKEQLVTAKTLQVLVQTLYPQPLDAKLKKSEKIREKPEYVG